MSFWRDRELLIQPGVLLCLCHRSEKVWWSGVKSCLSTGTSWLTLTILDLKRKSTGTAQKVCIQTCTQDTHLACRDNNSLSLGVLYLYIMALEGISVQCLSHSCIPQSSFDAESKQQGDRREQVDIFWEVGGLDAPWQRGTFEFLKVCLRHNIYFSLISHVVKTHA